VERFVVVEELVRVVPVIGARKVAELRGGPSVRARKEGFIAHVRTSHTVSDNPKLH
jgi:hypothetical protein